LLGAAGASPMMLGQIVTHKSAEHALSTVGACVSVISGAISSLPALVYRWDGDRRVEAPTHPLQRLIDRGPTPLMTWADFVEWAMGSVLLRGNAVAEIIVDNSGRLVELRPISWDLVSIVQLPGRRIAYDVTTDTVRGSTRRLLQESAFHLRDRNDDGGPVGVSRLHRAAGVLGNAQGLHQFSARLWRYAVSPSGALEVEGRISPEAHGQLQKRWQLMHAGSGNAGKVVILDQGARFKAISSTPKDAETLESRKNAVIELCRIFGVPPPIVQSR
jgi:HK97 family phage portal protein